MSLDHTIERFAVDCQHTRGGLLVSTSVFQHLRDVAAFNLR